MIIGVIVVIILIASFFSPNKGATVTILSFLIPLGALAGLAMSPNSETLFGILILVSFIAYGTGRYWRNPEGFVDS